MAPSRPLLRCAAILIWIECTSSAAVPGAKQIAWSDLRPEDQPGRFVEAQDTAAGPRQGDELVWQDDTQVVKLTGLLLPIDQNGDLIHEFILVPWAGACSHSASPPPNQLIHVFPEEPFRSSQIYEAITVAGKLRPSLDKAQGTVTLT
jgi:hypothetical protein